MENFLNKLPGICIFLFWWPMIALSFYLFKKAGYIIKDTGLLVVILFMIWILTVVLI